MMDTQRYKFGRRAVRGENAGEIEYTYEVGGVQE
jgi:hypothetical protein